ncbi:hypothetical protein K2P47_02905 [Patescibacteria group bacterium]|nr:hypothetical protein [Patescibacteria group bacterium]
MWNNFCAVVLDLFWFALGVRHKQEIFVYGNAGEQGLFSQYKLAANNRVELTAPDSPMFLAAPTTPPLLPIKTIESTHAQTTVSHTKETEAVVSDSAILHAPVVMYVCTHSGTPCVHAPQMDFDSVIEILPYGTAVTVIGYQGRFASVNRSNITGWIDKDALTPQKNTVWPSFVSGVTYGVDAPETIMTRTIISDMFGAHELGLPLQAGEYITVRLKSEHRSISWSRKRPRTAGSWATLLRGTLGIHIGVTPKTDTIMEWQTEGGEGRLGYVEAVAPDLTITISAVGVEEAGRYTVKTMTEEIWRELRPVFIEVA